MTSHVETNAYNFYVWQSWVYQTKSVENITWNICNSLKSEKMTSLVEETNTWKKIVWYIWVYQTESVEKNLSIGFHMTCHFFRFQGISNISSYVFQIFCLVYTQLEISWNLKIWKVLWKPILRKYLSDRAGYIKEKVWKTKLEKFLEFKKKYKCCGNKYFEIFCLTKMGISNKKGGKHNLKYLQFLNIWKNDKSCGNQYLENIRLT